MTDSDQQPWGRVDETGTVFVRTSDGERAVGQYPAGTIAMARQQLDGYSHGSQFFIVYEDTTLPSDDAGGYTVIGRVTSGLEELRSGITNAGTADGATDGAPAVPVTITEFTLE